MSNDEVGLVKYGEADLAYATQYQNYYAQVNPWYRNMLAGESPADREGRLFFGSELVKPGELERTEFYADWLRPQSIYEMLATPVIIKGNGVTSLTILRSRRHAEFEQHEIDLWKQLLPHIRKAVLVHQKVWQSEHQYLGALAGFDQLDVGVIFVASDGTLTFANASAEKILNAGQGLSVRFGRVCTPSVAMTETLLHAIRQASATGIGRSLHPGASLVVPFGPNQALSVTVSPVGADRLSGLPSGPTAMLILSVRGGLLNRSTTWLDQYRLTQAQRKLLAALVGGKQLSEYAEEERLSINTVKSHMKQIFERTGERRQADVIRKVLQAQRMAE
ncbi:hypothetical protein AB4072_05075 [Microvirga sp. 2MCAF38]|uniref:helix-turn-helix transcriptional regulator n=1 Tax=Microvirga sp. 2MCAF38 TaxID=3232989 RepID=UPI003F9B2EEF